MKPVGVSSERFVPAPRQVVFDVLTDHANYARFVWFVQRSELARQGAPDPAGVGALRLMRAGRTFREEIRVYEPPQRFGYAVLNYPPARDYVATVRLEEESGGTRMHYRAEGVPRMPGAVAVMRLGVALLGRAFAKEAVRRAGALTADGRSPRET